MTETTDRIGYGAASLVLFVVGVLVGQAQAGDWGTLAGMSGAAAAGVACWATFAVLTAPRQHSPLIVAAALVVAAAPVLWVLGIAPELSDILYDLGTVLTSVVLYRVATNEDCDGGCQ